MFKRSKARILAMILVCVMVLGSFAQGNVVVAALEEPEVTYLYQKADGTGEWRGTWKPRGDAYRMGT